MSATAAVQAPGKGQGKGQGNQHEKLGLVIDRLLADMEKELPPWRWPWTGSTTLPVSGVTHRPYRGFNTFVLWASAMVNGWTDNRFFTFAQVRKLKGMVKKGQSGTEVFLWRPAWRLAVPINGKRWLYEGQDVIPSPLPQGARKVLLLRTFYVWNACQCEGLPAKPQTPAEPAGAEMGTVETLLRELGAVVPVKIGDVASYVFMRDEITMPERKAFKTVEGFYSTMFHEYSHASGHKSRLDRDTLVGMVDPLKYAVEELVAESGAALVMAALGLPYSTQHAAYLQGWASRLRGLPEAERRRTVMGAFQHGQKAADWVLSGGVMPAGSAHNEGDSGPEVDKDGADEPSTPAQAVA
jgi:antirestriction protein ArdC